MSIDVRPMFGRVSVLTAGARARHIIVLAVALWCATEFPYAAPQLLDQDESELAHYRNAKSYIDLETPELIAAIPELQGIEPPASAEDAGKDLEVILRRVGENVSEFVEKFSNTASLEEITMERLQPGGKVEASDKKTFRFLVVARHDRNNTIMEEYRTDLNGKVVEPNASLGGLALTKGHASAAINFLPACRPNSFFRYLGKQKVGGEETVVVGFAQRPGWAELIGRLETPRGTALILVQGLAWIDPTSYQILRMRTDLLAPRADVGVKALTTEISYAEYHFPEIPGGLWLPREIVVNSEWQGWTDYSPMNRSTFSQDPDRRVGRVGTQWNGKTYRNTHRYSDYQLFGSTTKLKF
jgi:hypothetical protein